MPRARAGFTSYRNAFPYVRALILFRAEPAADWRKQARLMRIRKYILCRLWVQMAKRAEATYANRVLRPLVVWLRRIAPPSRRSQATTPRVARWLLPSLPSASSLLRRSRPSVASRSARARPVRPQRSRLPAPPLVWIGRSPREMPRRAVTSTATRPRVAARVRRHRLTPDAHISARASHAHARLLAPWLTASLPALAPFVRIPVSATPRSHGSPRRARPHDGHLHGDRGGG
jgi:hypothetical protein